LRFKRPGEDIFLASDPLPAPPITSLRELEFVAGELTNKRIDDLFALRKWLSVLVSPGSSLGGARPKANFREADGSLWIAKFPAHDDPLDIGAWEGVTHKLARAAGVEVPDAKVMRFGKNHHTFCVKRFDRSQSCRVFYSSAMTLLRKQQSEDSSYLEMAEFLHKHGAQGKAQQGLEQLFRRVVFNVAVGNRDDHLRNHGFLLQREGWIMAPAFDINPNPHKKEHVLNIDETDNRPNLNTVLSTSDWYELSQAKAEEILEEVVQIVRQWPEIAGKAGISGVEIEFMRHVFQR